MRNDDYVAGEKRKMGNSNVKGDNIAKSRQGDASALSEN